MLTVPKWRLILIAVAVLVLALVSWLAYNFSLQAEGPVNPSGYTSTQAASVTAIADAVSQDPGVSSLLAQQSCPINAGDYSIDPAALGGQLAKFVLGTANSQNGCYHIIVDGKITPQIYWMSLSQAVLVITGHVSVTIEYYDENCQLQTLTIPDFSFKIAFSIKNNGQVGGIVPLPTGKPICIITLSPKTIHYEIGTLDKDKCPNCPKTAPTIGGSS